ncbi:MAG: alpha/beta fold hydrolase, partial [Gemmatimonadota bacterium]
IRPFTRHADYVLVGQRGFDASRPAMPCGPSERPIFDDTRPYEARMAALAAGGGECRAFWEDRGIDRHGFNVREAATDVADVARALGYDRIALWGSSFGSHWATAVMRYHPELVARAVLGGFEGPDHTYDMPSHVLEALGRVAADAERSPRLRGRIPEGGLLAALQTVVERLERNPVAVDVPDESGNVRSVTVGHLIAQSVVEDGYSDVEPGTHPMAAWPADVIAMFEGDYRGLAREALDEAIEGFDYGPSATYFLYDCASGISRIRSERLADDPASSVLGRENWLHEGACPAWEVDLGEEFRTGFRTDVPTVIVQGTWDTSTPLENVREMLPRFSNVRFIPVVRGTHGALWLSFRDHATEEVQRFGQDLLRFAATGDASALPDSLVLPPVNWKRPDARGVSDESQNGGGTRALPTESTVTTDQEAEVRAAAQAYLDGLLHGDVATLESAFHPDTRFQGSVGDALVDMTFEDWAESRRGKRMRPVEEYRHSIEDVLIAGDAAVVRTDVDWPDTYFVDYLSLLRVGGEWKIVNKIWTQRPSPRAMSRIEDLPVPAEEASDYVGRYRTEGEDARYLAVTAEGASLRLETETRRYELYFQGDDTFAPEFDVDDRVRFERGADGRVERMRIVLDEETVSALRVAPEGGVSDQ